MLLVEPYNNKMNKQKNKYRVMLVIHALGYGGAGKMIVKLADALAQRDDLDVILYVEEKAGKHYPMDDRVKVYQETEFFKNYYTRHFQQIFQLRRRVKEIKPDLIISFQTNQNALAVLSAMGRHIPVIVSERGDPYQLTNIVAKLKNIVINKADGGVFQTHRAMEYFGKELQKKSRVIYNPCPPDKVERPKWEDRRDEIAFVARFDIQQKRQDLMVDAFAIVAKEHPEIKLVFYGKGEPDMTTIKEQVDRLGLSEQVLFKGVVNNVINEIKNSKLFVLSSDYEGMPNALIEAMVAGLPCVSTDCSPGGARELIENGVNGYVTPCGNTEKLADAINDMLDNPEKADVMGAKAQEITKTLAADKIFAQWNDYIDTYLIKK